MPNRPGFMLSRGGDRQADAVIVQVQATQPGWISRGRLPASVGAVEHPKLMAGLLATAVRFRWKSQLQGFRSLLKPNRLPQPWPGHPRPSPPQAWPEDVGEHGSYSPRLDVNRPRLGALRTPSECGAGGGRGSGHPSRMRWRAMLPSGLGFRLGPGYQTGPMRPKPYESVMEFRR